MAKSHIIVGLGYGDEGKGVFTDYLASTLANPIVIRYNGGHQAGHTVKLRDGTSHVFSSFGSGTLRDVPTFISRYCTIDPTGIRNEFRALTTKISTFPTLYVDPLAMVTTPYDKAVNIKDEDQNQHGSVGVGFGATIQRNTTPFKLYAMDLEYPEVVLHKLKAIGKYYKNSLRDYLPASKTIDQFVEDCFSTVGNKFEIMRERDIFDQSPKYQNYIFEGAQGVMLDMDHGFFPHVTHSNTTSKNAIEIMRRNSPLHLDLSAFDIYYLTRAYATRHGNGPFQQQQYPIQLTNNAEETNITNLHQGDFRTGMLDWDMVEYAMRCDINYSGQPQRNLVISCIDQLAGEYAFTSAGGQVNTYNDRKEMIAAIIDDLPVDCAFVNDSPYSDTIKKVEYW